MNIPKVLLVLCLVLALGACQSLENAPEENPNLDLPSDSPIELPSETPTKLPITLPTELPTEEFTLPPVEDLVETVGPIKLEPLPTQEVPMPELPSVPSGQLDDLVEQAKKDLAKRLSISVNQITVVQARAVTWPDSSLGCPKPGMMYMMVLSPGFQIILSAEGREYNYHAGQSGGAFYCESPSPPASSNSIDN